MSNSLAAVFDGTPDGLELRKFPFRSPRARRSWCEYTVARCAAADLHSYEGRSRRARADDPWPRDVRPDPDVGRLRGATRSGRQLAPRSATGLPGRSSPVAAHASIVVRGLHKKGQRAVKYGHEAFQSGRELLGGLAEHCLLVPTTAIVKLPDELPLATACPASCATATIVAALEAAGDVARSHRLHSRRRTAWPDGLGHGPHAWCAGSDLCRRPSGTSTRSLSFGATRAIAPEELATTVAATTEGQGFDVIVELSGSSQAFEAAGRWCAWAERWFWSARSFRRLPCRCSWSKSFVHLSIRGVHNTLRAIFSPRSNSSPPSTAGFPSRSWSPSVFRSTSRTSLRRCA